MFTHTKRRCHPDIGHAGLEAWVSLARSRYLVIDLPNRARSYAIRAKVNYTLFILPVKEAFLKIFKVD
jgi:hypothetical protein